MLRINRKIITRKINSSLRNSLGGTTSYSPVLSVPGEVGTSYWEHETQGFIWDSAQFDDVDTLFED